MKLFKLLQSQGIGSRKNCIDLIKKGKVSIGGHTVGDPKAEVPVEDGFVLNEKHYTYHEKVYLALNKPLGYECSHNPQHNRSVYELLPTEFLNRKVEAAGRLDVDTTGLLLFSDDGQFIHRIMSPKRECLKTYRATLKHQITEDALDQLQNGVLLRDGNNLVSAVSVESVDDRIVDITIGEGKYHQVRRMFAAVSNRVEKLHRMSVGGLTLASLSIAEGNWLLLTSEQLCNAGLWDKL